MNRRGFLRLSGALAGVSLGGGGRQKASALRVAGAAPAPRVGGRFAQAMPAVGARVVAVGIPGAGAIGAVGRFLPGGPIHDNAAFAAYTQPGMVLDPNRILVGSASNFGAPVANSSQAPGALLSIDPSGDVHLAVPASFAAADGQVSTLGGRLQLFSAQSPAFLNGINTPGAATADMAGVSAPVGLSINNAFGRIWPANVPAGLGSPSSESILDPTGIPLASAPYQLSGGVFAGDLTNRQPAQLSVGGLNSGAIGTALLGRSPDGGGRAVFAAVLADGSVIQMHTEKGVDGLAPAGTITPLLGATVSKNLRAGTLLNFEPLRILYISDPLANAVVALTLLDDRRIFGPGPISRITSAQFNQPIGLAPAKPETEDTDWASNTMLFEGSDFYVANRGDNSLIRVAQDGSTVAAVRVTLSEGRELGDARLSGIGVSADGTRIWVTVDGSLTGYAGLDGAVLELPAFGG